MIDAKALDAASWECFYDESYYGLWAVREAGERRWGHCFHVLSKDEADGLVGILNGRGEDAKRVDKPCALSEEQKREMVETLATSLLACEIPDGYDRNGSHSTGGYLEYKWSLRTYLRPEDEWKAEHLAEAALDALLSVCNITMKGD